MIYITGDTHGNLTRLNIIPAKKGDVIIILGDFGVVWSTDKLSANSEKKQLEFAREKEYTILFVDGNHENFDRIENFGRIEKYGAEVGVYIENIFHLKRGNIYTIEGKKFFVFGGGLSIDKAWRCPHVSYWEQELPNFAQYKNGLDNLEKENWNVDFILSHEGPRTIAAQLLRQYHMTTTKNPDYDLPRYLEEVMNKTTFKHWYFGHYHIPKTTFRDKFTCMFEGYTKL